jgi:hypothetical protein
VAWSRLILEQIKAFLLDQLEEDGGSERGKREVKKGCIIITKALLLLFDGFLSLIRMDHKDSTPQQTHQEGPRVRNKSHDSMVDNGTISDG